MRTVDQVVKELRAAEKEAERASSKVSTLREELSGILKAAQAGLSEK